MCWAASHSGTLSLRIVFEEGGEENKGRYGCNQPSSSIDIYAEGANRLLTSYM